MSTSYFVTHPEIVVDPSVSVAEWGLSARGFERIDAFCRRPMLEKVTDVFVSDEKKALDCARTLQTLRGQSFQSYCDLRENDRSSTGYVAPPRFWELVDEFFAHPTQSILGWERSIDAQQRIRDTVNQCIANRWGKGDNVFFSHGGVGTLLLCDLLGEPITRANGQPIAGGGCFFAFETETLRLIHPWKDIVP
ncbi:Broad specificity phosphatase PhoE [Phyllobacterium sp. CL33Tsu]|uniref:histidine phosphatase family protein n=1 Tax=Phyllobacterium sp. CL33Tsu TaxID=1798191 RepID=UPI0008E94CDC|nr:histidine phosphatase family protein [Phyllobacterium sp. CL33Tsu]SFJ35288.1 Broad specificity phosphatase PhoE [Phyllobacterium sp. CL33Tsu]